MILLQRFSRGNVTSSSKIADRSPDYYNSNICYMLYRQLFALLIILWRGIQCSATHLYLLSFGGGSHLPSDHLLFNPLRHKKYSPTAFLRYMVVAKHRSSPAWSAATRSPSTSASSMKWVDSNTVRSPRRDCGDNCNI